MAATNANSELWLSKGALAVPENQRIHALTVWCDPAIWGLALYDDQTPWFTLIECLQLLTFRHRDRKELFPGLGGSPQASSHERQSYRIKLNTNLRHLLFRDQEVARIAARGGANDEVRWRQWLERTVKDFPDLDLSYLKAAFSDDFAHFSEALELLRSAEVEQFGAKRWTSRHLQPVGEAMLFPDVKMKDDGFALDRRFFQRTGEILYLMLNRSADRALLEHLVTMRVLNADGPWNRIARRLQGPDADATTDEPKWVEAPTIGYLPVPHLARYDELARDWVSILSQSTIPLEDALEFLVRLSGLHQVIYIAERAVDVSGRASLTPFVVEMSGSARNNPVQILSAERYKAHKMLPSQAVEAFVQSYADTSEWREVGTGPMDCTHAKRLLSRRFAWTPKRTAAASGLSLPTDQLQAMLDAAKTRNHDIGSTFTVHAKKIGLLTARQRAGTWYSPSDSLLEALVLANVDGAIELGQFLSILRRRYHIVIGPEEARTQSGELPVPLEDLRENERRLEERLRVLGFINRKSDDCAFVVNPFAGGHVATGRLVHATA
ncbi:hypothetical protein [Geminicoccus flavidas]|uniref:hypothetical protein n=1 Tax=Geminicoccus flavidas TaxID=2506407 RepID=UPI00135AF110|nr:hypothetical protein [Geminicoccus flavidas]